MPRPYCKPRLVILICLLLPLLAGGQQVAPPHDRTYEQTLGDVRITTAVPDAIETQEIFGAKLYRNNVQPVWIQVENRSDRALWFFPVGLDDAYYTPLETAARGFSWKAILSEDVEDEFHERKMGLTIPAGGIRSGYVFSRVDEGTKSFNVDVFAPGEESYRMSFFVPVPGLRLDHYTVEFDALYDDDELVDVDLAGLARALEDLPCCVKDKKGIDDGDPLNIVFIGNTQSLYYTLLRAGWDETETVYGSALIKMGVSAVTGSEYRYSPVSALYVYGRGQDAAFQRARTTINERNHLRVWLTPYRFEDRPVWIGQISRDIGVRFTTKTITTHKIDPNVDETREFLIEDLAYAQGLARFGYAKGVGAAPYDAPRRNLTGDPYFTDGLRSVMWIADEAVSLNEIDVVDLGSHPTDEPM